MRVRVVLAAALATVAGALALDMSGSAPRTAGSDHTHTAAFVADIAPHQELCQPAMVLPPDARRLTILLGSFGQPVGGLRVRFDAAGGGTVARGALPAGAHEGALTIPLERVDASSPAQAVPGTLCVALLGGSHVAIAGEPFPPGGASERVAGRPQAGRIAVIYVRGGKESWWALLPTLASRFGLGKAPFLGAWTLPLMALLLLGVWVASARLLLRELT